MRRGIAVAGAGLVLVVSAALALPALFPVAAWKPTIQAGVKEATGRDLRIDGSIRLSLFPRLELTIADAGLSNPAGFEAPEILAVDRLALVLKILPLLSGKLVVDHLVVDRPVIVLERDAAGKPNWNFDLDDAPAGTQGESAQVVEMHLDDVRVGHGTIRYRDPRSATVVELADVGLAISMPSLDDPLQATGDLVWNGAKTSLDVTAADPRSLFAGAPSAVKMKIDTERLHVGLDGTAAAGASLQAAGALELDVPSVRELAAWLDSPLGAPPGTFGPLRIRSRVALSSDEAALSDAKVSFDGIDAAGSLALVSGAERPRVRAALDVKFVDLTPYLPPGQAKGSVSREGWSADAIATDAFRALDVELDLKVGGLRSHRVQIGQGSLRLDLRAGRFDLEMKELALYDGTGRGRLVLDGSSGEALGLDVDLHLAGVQVEPLWREATGGDRVSGRADIDGSLRGRGRSARDMVASLEGKGALLVRDGSIRGINLAAMVLNVAAAFSGNRDGDRTEFSRIGGTVHVAGGVLQNSDLELQSPVLQAEGAGTVDLVARTTDYRVSPKFVAPVVGQLTGGAIGMKVPVRIRGPWHDLRYSPDLAGMIRRGIDTPGALLKGARDFGKGIFGR